MKDELVEKLNHCKIGFYVNLELSGLDPNEFSADNLPNVEYYIEDGMLLDWRHEEVLDLYSIDYSSLEECTDPDDADVEKMTEFEYLVTEIICEVDENELSGCSEFEEMIDKDWTLLILAKDEDENIVEEISDYRIGDYV